MNAEVWDIRTLMPTKKEVRKAPDQPVPAVVYDLTQARRRREVKK